MADQASLRDDRWAKVAFVTGAVALGVYAVLWCVMWIPFFIDGAGLLILYPLFLLAWVPIEPPGAPQPRLRDHRPGEAARQDGWHHRDPGRRRRVHRDLASGALARHLPAAVPLHAGPRVRDAG
ncbi:hypothetical protein [Clavibacter tessellarius]|uniref:hypothetical protein n=1 Tax=Clavibacter tessellarius TaxID=31965 RepID=UPI00324309CC